MTTRSRATAFWPAGVFILLALSITGGCGDNGTSTGTTATAPTATGTTASAPTATQPTELETTAAPSTLTAAEQTPQTVVLGHDGLGVVIFGQPADTVIEVLSGLLGPPDLEEIQISPDWDRTVQWEDPFLYLQFTTWDHFNAVERPEPAAEGPIFHYYLTTSGQYATDTGITPGATVSQLMTTYTNVVFHRGCGDDLVRDFLVDPDAGWPQLPIFGLLDGDVENPETRIIHIGAGWDRNPC